MITLNMMTRQFVYLLANQPNVKLEFNEYDWTKVIATQSHVDFIIDNESLNAEFIDDLAEKTLHPAAYALATRLEQAKHCYELPHPKSYEWSIHTYKGVSIRGLINRKHAMFDEDGREIITNLVRFDILWSK